MRPQGLAPGKCLVWERPRLISPVPQRRSPRAPSRGEGTPEIVCLEARGRVCLSVSDCPLPGFQCLRAFLHIP